MGLLSRLFGGEGGPAKVAGAVYDRVMAAALAPDLYRYGLMTDTFEGRFQSVSLHSALVMRRLREAGAPGEALADALYRRVFSGFDYAYREKGVGDSSIARKVRKLGEEFFGLARALDSALTEGDAARSVEEALTRNGLGGVEAAKLAAYVIATDAALLAVGDDQVLAGEVVWPKLAEIT